MGKNCGNCGYSKRMNDQSVECHGNPPTPAIVGVQPGQFGGVQMQIEMLRPRMPGTTQPCHLYQPRIDMPDESQMRLLGKLATS